MVVTYFNTFFFCFIWRVVLIRYSDRGLVLNGRPNTQLLKKLHWLIFTSFACINILHFPIQKVFSGTFQETISGKVCLLQTFTLVNEVSRKTFIGAQMLPFLVNFTNIYFSHKVRVRLFAPNVPFPCCRLFVQVRNYLEAMCPNQRMYCLGEFGHGENFGLSLFCLVSNFSLAQANTN